MKFFVVCPCGCGCRFEVETPKRTPKVSDEVRKARSEHMKRIRAEYGGHTKAKPDDE